MVPKKRFKRDVTSIEYLPNELFVEVFNYLPDVDVVCAFSRLNQRFQSLTLKYCDTFDFKSVSKAKFNHVIRYHDMHRWKSLRLSDDDNTPGQVTHFCQIFSLKKYISQLKVLSIINMKSKIALNILSQLTSFSHLVSLSIGSICGKSIPFLQLDSLKHLVINSCLHNQWIKNFQLSTIQYTIEHNCTHNHDLIWPQTLTELKLFFSKPGDNEVVRSSLTNLPQLISLAINDNAWQSLPPDGQIWEKLITSSMPILKKFNFCFKFWKDFNLTSDITQIMSTFSTEFYLQEKSWFVQCDSHHQQLSIALLYSIPYAFQRFDIVTHSFDESITNFNSCSKTNLYKNVQILMIDVKCQEVHQDLIRGHIVHLNLKFPAVPLDWMYSMNYLCQLSFENHIDMSYKNFIRLLQNAPKLYSLSIPYQTLKSYTNQWKSYKACQLLSQKIRSLKICTSDCFRNYVKVDELIHIVRIFYKRCQHLDISVYSRNIVAGLILRRMQHLRSFKVQLIEHGNDLMITKKWLIEQNIAYKNLDCSIVVDGNEYSFWLGRRR